MIDKCKRAVIKVTDNELKDLAQDIKNIYQIEEEIKDKMIKITISNCTPIKYYFNRISDESSESLSISEPDENDSYDDSKSQEKHPEKLSKEDQVWQKTVDEIIELIQYGEISDDKSTKKKIKKKNKEFKRNIPLSLEENQTQKVVRLKPNIKKEYLNKVNEVLKSTIEEIKILLSSN